MQRSVKNALKELDESTEPFNWVKSDVGEKLVNEGYVRLVNVQTPRPPHDSMPVKITMQGRAALKRGQDVTEEDMIEQPVDTSSDAP